MAARGVSATVDGTTTAARSRAWAVATLTDPVRFYPKSGPLPGVVGVRHQTGDWDTVGRSRRLLLSDGGSVVERLETVVPDELFVYKLTQFRRLLGRLVDHGRAEWRFSTEGTGSRIRWTYTFFPRRGSHVAVTLIVRLLWRRYMERVLADILTEAGRSD
jgi:hypothetical protein